MIWPGIVCMFARRYDGRPRRAFSSPDPDAWDPIVLPDEAIVMVLWPGDPGVPEVTRMAMVLLPGPRVGWTYVPHLVPLT